MLRASMADLIAEVRRMIGDPKGDDCPPRLGDEDLQVYLDQNRNDIRRQQLKGDVTIDGPTTFYSHYYADRGWWEGDAILTGPDNTEVTPDEADYRIGRFVWDDPGQDAPVRITGAAYDVFGAAADALEAIAAQFKLDFDVSSDGQSLARSQRIRNVLDMAQEYRRQAQPVMTRQVRSDMGEGRNAGSGLSSEFMGATRWP